jgi:hypothetical protein
MNDNIKRTDAEFNPSNDNTYFIGERNSKRTAKASKKVISRNNKAHSRFKKAKSLFYPVEELFKTDAGDEQ